MCSASRRLVAEPFRENEVSGRRGFGMCRLKKLLEVCDRDSAGRSSIAGVGGVEGTGPAAVMVPRSGLLARDPARELGLEDGRLLGLETGADDGGETWSPRLSVLSSSESIQLLWSSGCASSASSGGGEEVVGVEVPDRLMDDKAEKPPKPPNVLW